MLSKGLLTLLLTLVALVSFTTAFQYDLTCDYGMSAAQCTSTYGTYCTSRGLMMKQGPSGTDCTTQSSPGPHAGVYCYCKFHYVATSKPTGKFDPNEILQQREEENVQAVPLPTPTFDPLEILQWTRDVDKRDEAALPLPTPTFDPLEILQWTHGNEKRAEVARLLPTPTFDPTEILQWTRDVEERDDAAVPLPTPTFDPTEILQWTHDIEKRDEEVDDTLPLPTPTFDPNEILQWTRDLSGEIHAALQSVSQARHTLRPTSWNNHAKERADAVEQGYPLPTPTFDPNEILQWTRDMKHTSEEEKKEVRNAHPENARQLSSILLSIASSKLGGELNTALGLTSTAMGSSSMPTTTVMMSSNTMMSGTANSSVTPSSTVTPVLPPKSGAAGRDVTGFSGLIGVLAVGFVAAL